MNKKEIRERMSEKRNRLSLKEQTRLSKQIAERVVQTDIYAKWDCICVYQAFRGEVSCEYIIKEAWLDNKKVYVPVTDADTKEIQFYYITEHTFWKEGAYGIMEPVIDEASEMLKTSSLIFMPGLAFDKQHHRLGYGGGYYDKYLASHRDCVTMALCYDFQILEEELPYEAHDILPDYIMTECRKL